MIGLPALRSARRMTRLPGLRSRLRRFTFQKDADRIAMPVACGGQPGNLHPTAVLGRVSGATSERPARRRLRGTDSPPTPCGATGRVTPFRASGRPIRVPGSADGACSGIGSDRQRSTCPANESPRGESRMPPARGLHGGCDFLSGPAGVASTGHRGQETPTGGVGGARRGIRRIPLRRFGWRFGPGDRSGRACQSVRRDGTALAEGAPPRHRPRRRRPTTAVSANP